MPNVKSAIKRARQNEKRRERNRAQRSAMRTLIKKAEAVAKEGSEDDSAAVLRQAMSKIGKAGKTHLVHPRKAARMASRLQLRINKAKAAKSSSSDES